MGAIRQQSIFGQGPHKLPIAWNAEGIRAGDKKYTANNHVPVFISPNPQSPRKYVVLNSGFTFREYDYLNNARQVPKLPDWAILDVTQPATPAHLRVSWTPVSSLKNGLDGGKK